MHDARGWHQSLSCMLEGAWRNGGGRVGQTHVRDCGSPVDYCSDVVVLYRLVLGGRGSTGAISRICGAADWNTGRARWLAFVDVSASWHRWPRSKFGRAQPERFSTTP